MGHSIHHFLMASDALMVREFTVGAGQHCPDAPGEWSIVYVLGVCVCSTVLVVCSSSATTRKSSAAYIERSNACGEQTLRARQFCIGICCCGCCGCRGRWRGCKQRILLGFVLCDACPSRFFDLFWCKCALGCMHIYVRMYVCMQVYLCAYTYACIFHLQ